MTLAELITALETLRDTIGVDPDVPVMIDGGAAGQAEMTDVQYPFAMREVWLS